jgi:hypothetical protein
MVRYKYKFCRKCKEKLPTGDFSEQNSQSVATCKACKIIARLTRRCSVYGINEVDFLDMLEYQDHSCCCCKTSLTYDTCVIDHCHTKGHVRGLLCRNCNLALGFAKDNKETLLNMIGYLEADR